MKIFTVIVVGTLVSGFASAALSQSESVIYSFRPRYTPSGKMLVDTSGDLLGVTSNGPATSGSVYRITEKVGTWTEKTIYKFGNRGDGSDPQSGLAQNANGTYYGTTYRGGTYGFGTVYSISNSGGRWSDDVLYSFTGGSDGGFPIGSVFYDKATGALYGTTSVYGSYDCGTVFQLAQSGGHWSFTTLYTFRGGSTDGCNPENELHLGASNGSLVGTTRYAGRGGYGTAFLLRERDGNWTEKPLYSFKGGNDGATPEDITVNTDNNMAYGITYGGGTHDSGVIYSLNLTGRPNETVLHSFSGGSDGANPVGLHIEATTGIVYGTTLYGGVYSEGTVFRVDPNDNGSESVIYTFGSHSGDGAFPTAGPSENQDSGTLYGSTLSGGLYGDGAVWSLTQ